MKRTLTLLAAGVLAAAANFGAQAQIKLGVVGPITGSSAAFGAQLKNGVEQAVDDINAAGGILGQKLSISLGDDVGDPKQGVSVANKFAGDGVRWVVGHFNSGVTIPASEIYAENNILMITPSATNPRVTERKLWNVFRTCGRDDQQGLVAAAHIAKHFAGKRIAILHDKTTYGQGLADETRKALATKGIKEVLYEGVNAGEKDFSAVVAKLKAAKVDLLYWGGLHTELGLIIRQSRDMGTQIQAMGADGIVSDEFSSIGGPGVEGTLMTFPPDPRNRAEASAVVKRFEARKINPEAYTLYSYAAVQIMKQAAEKAKSLDPQKVAATIRSGMEFTTVLGRMSFDSKGDRTNLDYTVYTWRKGADGKITYIENK
jgi:branched-chain amino acid transport system substrate-binding protein